MYCFNFTVGDRDFTVIHGSMDIVVWDAGSHKKTTLCSKLAVTTDH